MCVTSTTDSTARQNDRIYYTDIQQWAICVYVRVCEQVSCLWVLC